MHREEALAVLHEIYHVCMDSVSLTCISLDAEQVEHLEVGYQIRMKCELDNISRQRIEIVMRKHKLTQKEEKGYLVISQLLT
jgi:hypothetical protein